ncbi:YlaF family protein [Neobacillus dielmonensis]|uniref:YlaF family protein n=1 Tax=Neobacillus dielmonensis TaxID=1347369 RepID=UPI0005A69E3E|nr:YlaF family protein [Neobacillus dielmonensis]
MKQVNWQMLIFAILAAVSIMGMGISIAENTMLGLFGCLVALIVIMGLGFKTKKKLREKGLL